MSPRTARRLGPLVAAAMLTVLCAALLLAAAGGPAPLRYSTVFSPP